MNSLQSQHAKKEIHHEHFCDHNFYEKQIHWEDYCRLI
jgi:hypothetical protein